MKNRIRKWSLRIIVTCLLILGLLAGIAFNPTLLYANKSVKGIYTLYHQRSLDPAFVSKLNDANELLQQSELYEPSLKLSVCLNDGSYYPKLMQQVRGQAFGWGFQKVVVLMGNVHATDNYIELNGYKWNLTELLAHEATHCFQFYKYGLFKSNPVAHIPEWKWEGYPEYVARKNKAGLVNNISCLIKVENTDNNNWIDFDDSTGTVISYYRNWLLVQYCLDVRKMSYDRLLKDTMSEALLTRNMMDWYTQNNSGKK
jgi:hypothetical protein